MASEAVLDRHIEVTPGGAARKARIAGHRTTIQNTVIRQERMRLCADEIACDFDVMPSEARASLAGYHDRRAEIHESLQDERACVAELRRMTPSTLPEKLRA